MKTAVMTDTNSGIMKAEADSMGIFLIPMPVIIDDETHYEGIDLTEDSFYGSLTGGQNVSTSQPSPGDLMDLWDDILEQGYDEIIHIPMSSGLSASCSTAISLSDDYDGKVQVADNHRISVTQRESVMHAKKLAEAGKSAKEIKEVLEAEAYNSSIYIAVDTLEFLKKGGRITPAAAALGTLLRIKPVLQIQGEKLDSFSKVRTMKQARTTMLSAAEKDLSERYADPKAENTWIFVAHTQNTEPAEEFAKEIEEHYPKAKPVYAAPLSLSIACHIGPGSLAVAMSKKIDAESERKRYGL